MMCNREHTKSIDWYTGQQATNFYNRAEYNPYVNQSQARKHNIEEAFKELQAIRAELAILYDEFIVMKRELLCRLPLKVGASQEQQAK